MLEQQIDELRELAAGIHPAVLSSRGLIAAVDALAAHSPVPIIVKGALPQRLEESVESNAYFVIAEAVTNALKHAGASRIHVQVELADSLLLTIADDGRGGVPSDPAASGSAMGLIGLADRVSAFDGTLTIESPPGAGTKIRAEIPTESASRYA